MEIRKNTPMEYSHRHKIKGSSTINHNIRVSLKISLEEYVILDFIFLQNQKSNKTITFADYYRETGFIKEDIIELFKLIKAKKLLIFDDKKGRVDVSEDWKILFSTGDSFDRIWLIHPKGNKQVARGRLPKVLKKISIESLIEKLTAYVKWCNTADTFKKDLSTWLNPELEHWNNTIEDKSKPTVKANITFKK